MAKGEKISAPSKASVYHDCDEAPACDVGEEDEEEEEEEEEEEDGEAHLSSLLYAMTELNMKAGVEPAVPPVSLLSNSSYILLLSLYILIIRKQIK